jgi:hypothetical protein
MSSGVVLTTLGTIHPDHLELDVEQSGVEMDDIRIGVDLEILSTAVGGDDGEPLSDQESHEGSPAPAYTACEDESIATQSGPYARAFRNGVRVDVEQATS